MSLSKISSDLYDDWVPVLQEHKLLVGSGILLTPVLYCSVRLWSWWKGNKERWRTLKEHFPGPETHWLYGNLHQVSRGGGRSTVVARWTLFSHPVL